MAFHFRLFTLNKSHDIIVPLVWASTVTSFVDISVTFTSVRRSKTVSPFTKIHMQVVTFGFKSALLSGLTVLKL